jgi:hypothetical protein
MEKMPPIEKIHEAYSAIADGCVRITGDTEAHIRSSGGEKEYTVTWDGSTYFSNDSASYWQGYASYTVISVLMLQGRLPLGRKTATLFSGVNWSARNTKYKRNYAKVAADVLSAIEANGGDAAAINVEIEKVYEELRKLDITIKRGPRRLQNQSKIKVRKTFAD